MASRPFRSYQIPTGDWALESGIYEIQPIPEPGTWLLVPTAVGLAWLAYKKRKASKEHVIGVSTA